MVEDGDPQGTPGGEQPSASEQPNPEEEELRQRLEEELRQLRVEDVLLQSVVSLINLTSRRIAKPDERDLEQARVGIEAIRALAGLLDGEPAAQVREALSQLQVAYAQEAGGTAPGEGEGPPPGEGPLPDGQPSPEGPGGAAPGAAEDKPPSGLWTPHDRG